MVRNILKNGTEVADLSGIILRESEVPEVYDIIRSEGYEKKKEKKHDTESHHNAGNSGGDHISVLS